MLAIVQARMSSKRLPGKMLLPLGGKTIFERVITQLNHANYVSRIIVATSEEKSDDLLVEHCNKLNISCYRGQLNNVASRFLEIIKNENDRAFIRVSGDSPLIDPTLVDDMAIEFNNSDIDLLTNIQKRSYPKGQSIEIINCSMFRQAYPEFSKPTHFEHVTPFFYENASLYQIKNMVSKENFSLVNLSVDTQEDLERLEVLVASSDFSEKWQSAAEKYRELFLNG